MWSSRRNIWTFHCWVLIIIWIRISLETRPTGKKIIRPQITIKFNLIDRNTPPHSRYKPEPVLEWANMILHWDRSTITDKTFPTLRLRKLRNLKIWPWKSKISGSLTTNVRPHSYLNGRSGYQKLINISKEYRFNQNHIKIGAKSNAVINV